MSVLLVEDKKYYYKIDITLRDVMKKKGINRFRLAQKTNTKIETINRFYFNNVYKIDLDVLGRICLYLNCDISDVLKFNIDIISK